MLQGGLTEQGTNRSWHEKTLNIQRAFGHSGDKFLVLVFVCSVRMNIVIRYIRREA